MGTSSGSGSGSGTGSDSSFSFNHQPSFSGVVGRLEMGTSSGSGLGPGFNHQIPSSSNVVGSGSGSGSAFGFNHQQPSSSRVVSSGARSGSGYGFNHQRHFSRRVLGRLAIGTSARSDFNHKPSSPFRMLPPRPQPSRLQQTSSSSLSLVSPPDANGGGGPPPPILQERVSISEQIREFPSGRDSWPTTNHLNHSLIRHVVPSSDYLSLRDVAREKVDVIAQKMQTLPVSNIEKLKNDLRILLERLQHKEVMEEFVFLQKVVQSRDDLTHRVLILAHRVQLEVLVAIKTGIQAFLHPNVKISKATLVDVFFYKKCRNIACQSSLPADECTCGICAERNGFCNVCMCVFCSKYDFEVNTCKWIGCEYCTHWTHTDCAIENGYIGTGPSGKSGDISIEMLFRCRACNRSSKLLGWVKDVFQYCASTWQMDALVRELDFVRKIFRGSEDPEGRKLFWKCEEIIEKLGSGVAEPIASNVISMFFQELDIDPSKTQETDEGGRLIEPQEAINRIADVIQETITKMEMVAEEKLNMVKKARLDVEACDEELQEKNKEVNNLQLERQQKKLQIDELENIVRLKQAEADMFELKANEAKREAERLQRIAMVKKSENTEEDYASCYLKQRMKEAEVEKQFLFEKMKLQESTNASQNGPGSGMYSQIQDMLKNMYTAVPEVPEGQSNGSNP